jgi:hypothetical protein
VEKSKVRMDWKREPFKKESKRKTGGRIKSMKEGEQNQAIIYH